MAGTTVDIADVLRRCKEMEQAVVAQGYAIGTCRLSINSMGDHLSMMVRASPPGSSEYGDDARSKLFTGKASADELDRIFSEASEWVNDLPSVDDRGREIMAAHLAKSAEIAEQFGLHSDNGKSWDAMATHLRAFSREIAENGLPKPDDFTAA